MAKLPSTFRNMVLSLSLISMGAAACLSFVYVMTKEPIARSSLDKKLNAIRQVVPEFNNNPFQELIRCSDGEGDTLDVYPAKMDNKVVAYAISTFSKTGFSGTINLMVGLRPDGTIINISVLDQKETPGLGAKMTEDSFRKQFRDRDPSSFKLKVKKDGGNVDAITAATISSRAFCDAVRKASETLQKGGLK